MLEKREFDRSDFLWRLSTAITVVSGFYVLIVFTLLLVNYIQIRDADPVNNELIMQMRQDYAAQPKKDEVFAERIQQLDLLTRKAFFTSQEHLRIGAIMLLIGVTVFLVAFKYMLRWRREKPELAESPTAEKEFLAFAHSRQLIVWGGVGLLAAGLLTTVLTQRALISDGELPVADAAIDGGGSETIAVAIPDWQAMEQNWTSFRGPGSSGTAFFDNAPTEWDVESDAGIRWKSAIDMPGPSSPVIWGDRIFLSSADETTRAVFSFDADSGEQLWKNTLNRYSGTPEDPPPVTEETGYAAPTMVVHGDLVFAMFANGDLVAYDFEGNERWGKNVGVPDNHYGHSSSLIAYGDLLYVQFDDSMEPRLMALEIATGKIKWTVRRETISWASPILARTEFGAQLILNSTNTVDAYAPDTGKLLWSLDCLSGEVAPSPVYSNGMVFAANEFAVATSIRLSEGDDGVQAEVAWEYDEYLPETSSPIGDGERFYFATTVGEFVCLDAATGEELWVHEFDDGFSSSPILVGDRIYLLDLSGNMYIMRAASEFELIATHNMGAETYATPAFMDGRIYVRTTEELICIEAEDA